MNSKFDTAKTTSNGSLESAPADNPEPTHNTRSDPPPVAGPLLSAELLDAVSSAPSESANTVAGSPSSSVPAEASSENQLQNPKPQTLHGPRSKISRLPKTVRDKLNFMLRDGLPHQEVLDRLGDDAKHINVRNISHWHASPDYQHWLLEQQWLENLRLEQEPALDLLADFDGPKFNQAVLQLAISRLFLSFRHLDSGNINDKLGGNARSFANLVNALSRACRETTNLEKYRDACARAIAAELKQLNVDRDLSDREYELLVKKMDQVFKVARRPKPDAAATAPATTPPA